MNTSNTRLGVYLYLSPVYHEHGEKSNQTHYPAEKDGMGQSDVLKKGRYLRHNKPEGQSSHRSEQSPRCMGPPAYLWPKDGSQSDDCVGGGKRQAY